MEARTDMWICKKMVEVHHKTKSSIETIRINIVPIFIKIAVRYLVPLNELSDRDLNGLQDEKQLLLIKLMRYYRDAVIWSGDYCLLYCTGCKLPEWTREVDVQVDEVARKTIDLLVVEAEAKLK